MNYHRSKTLPAIFVLALLTLAACSDDSITPAVEADFEVTIENTGRAYTLIKSGVFSIPTNATSPAPIFPGEAYEFDFTAPLGARLSLATMFVQSNDWFYAPGEAGLELYAGNGDQITGDVTSEFLLYDAGTEADEEPGTGMNQAPRQSSADTGAPDPDNTVRLVTEAGLPAPSEVLKVTLFSTSTYGFRVRIENVSTSSTLNTSDGSVAVPLSPGVFVVHGADQSGVLFETGLPDMDMGLEAIAEDGSPAELQPVLADETGITNIFAPGAFAVYEGENPIFMDSEMFPMNGLEGVAEDGTPDMLAAALGGTSSVTMSGAFAQPVGSSMNGPLTPGNSYRFIFSAQEGELLNFATMYVQSNDLFFAGSDAGIELFPGGSPVSGDITGMLRLWDAGTEANEEPGVGMYQAPRQSGPNTGPADSNTNVRPVSDSFMYPNTGDVIRVTIRVIQ